MKFYIELKDKRNGILKELLHNKGFKTAEFLFENTSDVQKNDVYVFSPAKKFKVEELLKLPEETVLFSGNLDSEAQLVIANRKIRHISFLSSEEFAYKNAALTAEGVLAELIKSTDKSVYENNVLILGLGRIGKAVSVLFKMLGINFSIATFNKEEFSYSSLYSGKCFYGESFKENLAEFDVIINTIPFKIFENTKKIKSKTVVLETASVDCLEPDGERFTYIKLPGLPQKYTPESAAMRMMELILNELKIEGENHG